MTLLVRGGPQGSVLGLIFWNIWFNSVIRKLEEDGLNVSCYADDTVFTICCDSLKLLESRIVDALRRTTEYLSPAGLRINGSKTEVIVRTGSSLRKYNPSELNAPTVTSASNSVNL